MTRRSAGALVGGLAAAFLAGAMALGINLGILGAAGSPRGPGALGSEETLPVSAPARAGTDPVLPPAGDEATPPRPDHRSVAPRGEPLAAPSPAGWSPAPSPAGAGGWTWTPPGAPTVAPDSPAPHAGREVEHTFGASNDD